MITEFWNRKKIYIILVVLSLLGMYASFALSIENYLGLVDVNHVAACSINDVLNCSKLFSEPESHLLGFPNMYFGIATYSISFAYSFICLFIQERSKILEKIGFFAGLGAITLSYYLLFYVSMFKASVLCIFCMASAFASTNIFFSFLSINYQVKYLKYIIAIWNILVVTSLVLFYITHHQ